MCILYIISSYFTNTGVGTGALVRMLADHRGTMAENSECFPDSQSIMLVKEAAIIVKQ